MSDESLIERIIRWLGTWGWVIIAALIALVAVAFLSGEWVVIR